MTMRYVLKFYPITDAEIPQAKEAIAEMLGVIQRRQGHAGAAPITDGVESNPEDYCKGAKTVSVDSYVHFNSEPQPMCFGAALAALKAGKKVARAGWNGKGMFVVYQKGYPDGIPINKNTAEAAGIPEGTVCRFRPYLMLYTAQGDFAQWQPSGSDCLADDWEVVS